MIKDMIMKDKDQLQKTLELASDALNQSEVTMDKTEITPQFIMKFRGWGCMNDPEFAKIHSIMQRGIANGKPKNYIKKDDLTMEQAEEAFKERQKLILDFSKQREYKAIVEEIYLSIISG